MKRLQPFACCHMITGECGGKGERHKRLPASAVCAPLHCLIQELPCFHQAKTLREELDEVIEAESIWDQ